MRLVAVTVVSAGGGGGWGSWGRFQGKRREKASSRSEAQTGISCVVHYYDTNHFVGKSAAKLDNEQEGKSEGQVAELLSQYPRRVDAFKERSAKSEHMAVEQRIAIIEQLMEAVMLWLADFERRLRPHFEQEDNMDDA